MATWLLILLFLVWLAAIVFLRHYRIWLPYYLLATVGCAYWLILVAGEYLQLELLLARSVAWAVHEVTGLVGVSTRIFANAPGILLVLIIVQEVGWTVLHIGVESSGLLEVSVLASLLAFYPGWHWRQRVTLISLGLLATWLANVFRVLIIVVLLSRFGKEALVLAHTYVGKLVFFLLIMAIFWRLITLTTLRDLRRQQSVHSL